MDKEALLNEIRKMTLEALIVACLLFICLSCKSVSRHTKTTSEVKIETIYKDSVTYIDSIIPVERYYDIVRDYDTLFLETSQAKAKCWVDSIFLKGSIENKKAASIKYVDKWHVRDSIVYKDKEDYDEVEKIVTKKNPVNYITVGICVILLFNMIFYVLKHFYNKDI